MSRGRPSKSEIREKITVLLERLEFSYGYEIYKHYKKLFGNATSRVIYYHLKKGSERGEFVMVNVKRVPGNYTWGDETERVYYSLGPFAKTKKKWWDQTINTEIKPREIDYDWTEEIKKKIGLLKNEVKKGKETDKKKLKVKCEKLSEWVNNKIEDPTIFNKELESIKLFLE